MSTLTSANTDAADGVARKEHGINDGSGHQCHDHSYTGIDGAAKARIDSLSALLSDTYGVKDARLVRALCALGEGVLTCNVCCGIINMHISIAVSSLTCLISLKLLTFAIGKKERPTLPSS